MAGQEEPLYDFPEPVQSSQQKFQGHQRTQGSLRSVSVLDRLLLTVPVWLQLSINPATALHILQREPPGTFLVRKSRTSQKNVLCVRLADDSVPSFVRQFGIREEQSTLSLETSAISFPDLPRLISFYCVSRDVLPFPLELPDAIARATSHKELESISHMGIEFWNSHLNVRGPREAPKPENHAAKKPDPVTTAPPAAPAQPSTNAPSQLHSDEQPKTETEAGDAKQPAPENPTLFHEFCPITTRSPRELDYGIGLGALCFINPLFLQSQSALSRKRLLKRSLKVRVSMETSSMLSPPLSAPPPPPLMPKTKKRCKIQKQGQGCVPPGKKPHPQSDLTVQDTQQDAPAEAQAPAAPHLQPEEQELPAIYRDPEAQLPTVMEDLQEDSDYMQPPPAVNFPPSLSPYHSPAGTPPLFLKPSPPLSPRSLSPYQSPVIAPRAPFPLSPHHSPIAAPSISPKVPPCLSPFTTSPFSQLEEDVYHTPAAIPLRADQQRSELGPEEKKRAAAEGAGGERKEERPEKEKRDGEGNEKRDEKEEKGESLVLQMSAACLEDTDSSSSFSSLEGAAETAPQLLMDQNNSSQEIT